MCRAILLSTALLLLAALNLFAQTADSSSTRLVAPPTKWDSSVLEKFFPDPRAALQGPRPARIQSGLAGPAKNPPKSAGFANSAQAETKTSAAISSSSAIPWSKLISAETLQDEIKSLQPQLANDVKTQPAFLGGAFKKSRRSLTLLATLFAVISDYDGDVKWKAQGAAARDAFARSAYNCNVATEQSFRDVRQRSDDLATLLRGDVATPIEKPDPPNEANDWSKIAELKQLMARFDSAQKERIAPDTSVAANFKKNGPQLQHEAELVAALAHVISRPGMDNTDDQSYIEFAAALEQTALDLCAAVQTNNYEAARTAAGNLSKACANCHEQFR